MTKRSPKRVYQIYHQVKFLLQDDRHDTLSFDHNIWPNVPIQKFNILSSLTVYFRFLTLTLPLCVLYFRFLTCILWVGPLTLLFRVFFFWLLTQLFNILSKSQKPKYLWVVGLVHPGSKLKLLCTFSISNSVFDIISHDQMIYWTTVPIL